MKKRGRIPLRRLVESAWLGLNGPACYAESALTEASQVFLLLESMGQEVTAEELERRLGTLYAAPDPSGDAKLQVLTIHKAKGLEFDTVILPGLGRGTRTRERELLRWLEHPDFELLLAPIPPALSEQQEPTYQAIGRILQEKDELETLRLLYVAATRARRSLHLLAHAKRDAAGMLTPARGSLLATLWPTCAEEFSLSAIDAPEEVSDVPGAMPLRRLPVDWRGPELPASLSLSSVQTIRASDTGHYYQKGIETRRTEEGRAIGTLVHYWLERIAREGMPAVKAFPHGRSSLLDAQLGGLGVPQSRREVCRTILLNCIMNAVGSERGKWLLAPHRQAASELEVNGLVEGELVRASIDRTFVDEGGLRWVVDYKTSSPKQGEDSASFMAREGERYRGQLKLYEALLKQLEPQREIRAALYFPMIDGWLEFAEKPAAS